MSHTTHVYASWHVYWFCHWCFAGFVWFVVQDFFDNFTVYFSSSNPSQFAKHEVIYPTLFDSGLLQWHWTAATATSERQKRTAQVCVCLHARLMLKLNCAHVVQATRTRKNVAGLLEPIRVVHGVVWACSGADQTLPDACTVLFEPNRESEAPTRGNTQTYRPFIRPWHRHGNYVLMVLISRNWVYTKHNVVYNLWRLVPMMTVTDAYVQRWDDHSHLLLVSSIATIPLGIGTGVRSGRPFRSWPQTKLNGKYFSKQHEI